MFVRRCVVRRSPVRIPRRGYPGSGSAPPDPLMSSLTGPGPESALMRWVLAHSEKGRPDSVLECVDTFCKQNGWMMHLGARKGRVVDDLIRKRNASSLLEIGSYCGYSAVTLGRHLIDRPQGHLFSVETNPTFAGFTRLLVQHAGLEGRVTVLQGPLSSVIDELMAHPLRDKAGLSFVLLDHSKAQYLPDLRLLEERALLADDAVIVADNASFPTVQPYRDYMGAAGSGYRSEMLPFPEPSRPRRQEDAMMVSTRTSTKSA